MFLFVFFSNLPTSSSIWGLFSSRLAILVVCLMVMMLLLRFYRRISFYYCYFLLLLLLLFLFVSRIRVFLLAISIALSSAFCLFRWILLLFNCSNELCVCFFFLRLKIGYTQFAPYIQKRWREMTALNIAAIYIHTHTFIPMSNDIH